MKDQISSDLLAGAAKVSPAAAATAATYTPGLSLSEWAMVATIVYTLVLTATTVVKNWGEWMTWWQARAGNVRQVRDWYRDRKRSRG